MDLRTVGSPSPRRAVRRARTLAHVSDLHIGRSEVIDQQVVTLGESIAAAGIDHVIVSGDVTHRGKVSEWRTFETAFTAMLLEGRLTVVPGNSDRLGEDVGHFAMGGRRIDVVDAPGLHIVCFDSTATHNKSRLNSHGVMTDAEVTRLILAVREAPRDHLVILTLHHHLLPLPADHRFEALASWLRRPYAEELPLGMNLLRGIEGRCDLVLHGHRHRPTHVRPFAGQDRVIDRPLQVINAGSSPEIGGLRVFTHANGRLCGQPVWMSTAAGTLSGSLPAHGALTL